MGKLMDKVLGFIGFEVQEVEEGDELEAQSWGDNLPAKGKKPNLVSIHNSRPIRMVVVRPTAFDQVQVIADHLKSRRPVIVNLEDAEKETAKRVLDFVSGTAYAINGCMQKVSNSIFLFVPNNVEVTGELVDEFRDQVPFAWNNVVR